MFNECDCGFKDFLALSLPKYKSKNYLLFFMLLNKNKKKLNMKDIEMLQKYLNIKKLCILKFLKNQWVKKIN